MWIIIILIFHGTSANSTQWIILSPCCRLLSFCRSLQCLNSDASAVWRIHNTSIVPTLSHCFALSTIFIWCYVFLFLSFSMFSFFRSTYPQYHPCRKCWGLEFSSLSFAQCVSLWLSQHRRLAFFRPAILIRSQQLASTFSAFSICIGAVRCPRHSTRYRVANTTIQCCEVYFHINLLWEWNGIITHAWRSFDINSWSMEERDSSK